MTTNTFRLTTRSLDSTGPPLTVVEVDGEIDVTGAQAFAQAIIDVARPATLILDLTNLKYLDSAGFAALDRLLSQRPIAVVLEPHSPIRGAVKLVGLRYYDSVDVAAEALHG